MAEIDIWTSSAGFLSDEYSKQDCWKKKMVLLEKLWDELVDRSETNCRLAGLRKITTPPLIIATTDVRGGKCKRNRSVAGCSAAAVTPTAPVCKDSIFPAAGVEPAGRSFSIKLSPLVSTMGFIVRR